MAGPIEILIVAGTFGLVATYLFIVSRFINGGEESPAPDAAPNRERVSSSGFRKQVHAH